MTKKEFQSDMRVIERHMFRAISRAKELRQSSSVEGKAIAEEYLKAAKEQEHFRDVTLTNFWTAEAARRALILPEKDNRHYWRPLPNEAPFYSVDISVLTQDGFAFLKRQMLEDRHRNAATIATVLSAIAGLIGTLIGLLSILFTKA